MRTDLANAEIKTLRRQGADRQAYFDLADRYDQTAANLEATHSEDLAKWERGEGNPRFADPRHPEVAKSRATSVQHYRDVATQLRQSQTG